MWDYFEFDASNNFQVVRLGFTQPSNIFLELGLRKYVKHNQCFYVPKVILSFSPEIKAFLASPEPHLNVHKSF